MMKNLTDQEIVRREKVKELEDLGIKPFGHAYKPTSNSKKLQEKYLEKTKEELEEINKTVIVAGRIVLKRVQGKAGFITLQDRDGRIQIYVRFDDVGEFSFNLFKHSDLGDIIGIKGHLFRTKTNELTVWAKEYTHLTKALKPLPDKWSGLQDVEEARRRRYVDLIVNEKAREIAFIRPKIIRAFQKYFDSKGFVEVETPILQPILGGASARPFITYHNTLDMDFYLRIATELHLKRLIVGGLEKVYEIGRLFRNEGMSSKHNPEFTTVEAYQAYTDMEGMMELIENLLSFVAYEVLGTYDITYQGKEISLKPPFKRVTMCDAVYEYTKINFKEITSLAEAKKLAKKHDIFVEKHFGIGHIIEGFFDKYVEPNILAPTFVYEYPIEISPLAKKNKKDPRFTDRFELFIDSREYANAFSELNDILMKRRFLAQLKERELGNEEASEMDTDFVEALEYGLPPTGGLGIGIDRFVMLLTDSASIRDIILFPHMRNK